jgi:7-cyano-7-deazaguanine synthase in queuosine biosynthesis
MQPSKRALVLFSGGKDSSAATIEMIRAGYSVVLFTHHIGQTELCGPNGDSAPDIRFNELHTMFPTHIDAKREIRKSAYLIRKLALEKTNKTHVVYPLALALAVDAEAIIYCLEHGIQDVACGYSAYQATEDRYIEQSEIFWKLSKSFFAELGITYHAPVIDKSEQEIMDILDRNNISSNSLENKSLFNGIEFDMTKTVDFWNESLPICRDYIKSRSATLL